MSASSRKTKAQLLEEIVELRARLEQLEPRPAGVRAELLESLTASEARYRSLLDHMPSGVAVYNAMNDGEDFVFLDFNESGARIEGLQPADVIGKRVTKVFPGVVELGLLDVFRRVWRTGEPAHHPISLYRDNRLYSWRENYVYRLPTGEIVAVYDDVTDRKQAELDRGRLFELSLDMLCVAGLDGYFKQFNPAWTRTLGWTAEELKARPWLEFVHPDDREATEDARMELADDRSVLAFENRCRHKDGSYRWLSWSSQPVSEEGLVFSVVRDVTEQRRVDDELRRARQSWEDIFQAIGNPAVILDADSRIIAANRAVVEATGQSEALLRGKLCWKVFHGPEAGCPPDSCPFAVLRRTGKLEASEMELEVLAGQYLVSCTPVTDDEDRLEKAILIATDITERKRAEECEQQHRHSQKMEAIGTLAGGVAHDFNNLLTGILYFSEDLKRLSQPDGEVHEAATQIEHAAERAAELTRQLLGFARKGKFEEKPVDATQLFGDVVAVLRRTVDKRITISQKTCVEPAVILGDASQLQQVVLNLGVNASDAMPEGGELTFETLVVDLNDTEAAEHDGLHAGRHVEIRVSDTGTGIPEELRDRIFEPFFTTKAADRGTGMGLATVYGIVQNHGGSVLVESAVGRGTTFRVLLPLRELETMPAQTTAGTPVRGQGRILVVDDEAIIRNLAVRMLGQLGYEVVTANDGQEAVESFSAHAQEIDLVILDLVMPRMSGRDCLARLRAIDPDVRILLSSGYSPDDTITELIRKEDLGFIQKPYVVNQLAQAVAEALDSSRTDPPR